MGPPPPVTAAPRHAATKLLVAAVRPGMHVVDVGAHAGAFTLLLARAVGPTGRVFAFEPRASHRRALHGHLVQNGLAERVTVLPFGLADEYAERPLAELGDGPAAARAREFAAVRRLDAVRDLLGIGRIDLMRIDCGGDEPAVLRGAAATLGALRPLLSIAFDQAGLRARGSDVREQLRLLHDLGYEACTEHDGLPFDSDEAFLQTCGLDRRGHALLRPVEGLAGLPIRLHADVASLRAALGLLQPGVLLEDDLDVVENDCELHGRKRHDAEVLCSAAASRPGPCLDLGTSFGRSAFKLATNVGGHPVFTVNMLPEQAAAAGVHVTHVLTKAQIGSYCRERGVANVRQVYADTGNWRPDAAVADLALAFVDACHDTDAVRRDSHLCWQRLRPGGLLLWHDFSPVRRHRHDWIRTSMQGVAAFLADVGHAGPVHHVRGSWIGLIEKGAR